MAEQTVIRKLTTILAADVVGYSRLMAADEEATHKTLKVYRGIIDGLIQKHYGRLVGTAGDAVLVEFGSAVEAVRCAISIQEELAVRNAELSDDRKMLWRIGINVGDVIVDDGDLFGDGVNVAARLEGVADPGGICISGSAFEQVKNKISIAFEDTGPQKVKNIPQPVSTFRLIPGPVSVVANRSSEAPTVGADKAWRNIALAAAAAVLVLLAVAGYAIFGDRAGKSPNQITSARRAGPAETPRANAGRGRKPQSSEGSPSNAASLGPKPPIEAERNLATGIMVAKDIESFVAGLQIRGRTIVNNRQFTIKLRNGGTATVEVVRPSGGLFQDTGNWWASNAQFCMKFPHFAFGRTMCPQFHSSAGKISATRPNGTPLDWVISK